MMSDNLTNEMDAIRRAWSKQERESRKQLAGAMQLQLHQLVVLAELARSEKADQRASVEIASAC